MTSGPPQLSIIPPASHVDAHQRPKKRRRRDLVPEPPHDPYAAEVLPEEVVSQLLNRSSAMILRSVGFTGARADVQERMRKLMEDCAAPPPPRLRAPC